MIEEPKEVTVSPDGFLNMLMQLNGGAVIDELDREMLKGVQAVLDNGGKTEITLKVSISQLRDLESAMSIKHDVIAKHPKEERPLKAMFLTKGNGLSDQQQDQHALDLGAPIEKATVSPLTPVKTEGEK